LDSNSKSSSLSASTGRLHLPNTFLYEVNKGKLYDSKAIPEGITYFDKLESWLTWCIELISVKPLLRAANMSFIFIPVSMKEFHKISISLPLYLKHQSWIKVMILWPEC